MIRDMGIIGKFRKFLRAKAAVAAIEFGLAMPVLIALSIGGYEVTRYIIVQQKLSKTATIMADLVARMPKLTAADVTNIYNAVPHLMEPYTMGADGVVIISNISNNGTATKVNWQRKAGGTYVANSKFGNASANATLPAGFTLATNEDTITAEVYYRYRPLIGAKFINTRVVYKAKFAKPRLGALTTINP